MTEDVLVALIVGVSNLLAVLACGVIVVWMKNPSHPRSPMAPRKPSVAKDRLNAMVTGNLR